MQIGASTRYDRILCLLFRHTSAVLPSVHPKDEKPITDIPGAPSTAPQIAGFRLGYFFINGASVSGDLPPRCQGIFPDLNAAARGPEREFVLYPMRYQRLHQIDRARSRGIKLSAAANPLQHYIVSFFDHARHLQYIL
jgi:hypothetical protein